MTEIGIAGSEKAIETEQGTEIEIEIGKETETEMGQGTEIETEIGIGGTETAMTGLHALASCS